MPKFIESYATHQFLPPYWSPDVSVQVFIFELDKEAIQKYCDERFNIGNAAHRGMTYKAMDGAQFGAITVIRSPRISSLDTGVPLDLGVATKEWDHVEVTEVCVAIPVCRYRHGPGNILVDRQIEWYEPLVVTDSPTWAISNREVVGLQTLWGRIALNEWDAITPITAGYSLAVSMPTWQVFSPRSPQEILPFLDIKTGPPVTGENISTLPDAAGLADADTLAFLEELKQALPDFAPIATGTGSGAMQFVFLKQFRDARIASLAVYQALVGARLDLTEVKDLKFFDPVQAKVTFHTGAMVNQILGGFMNLDLTGLGPNPPSGTTILPFPMADVTVSMKLAFSFKANSHFHDIKTLYRFATHNARPTVIDDDLM